MSRAKKIRLVGGSSLKYLRGEVEVKESTIERTSRGNSKYIVESEEIIEEQELIVPL